MVATTLLSKGSRINLEERKGCLPRTRKRQTRLLEKACVVTQLLSNILLQQFQQYPPMPPMPMNFPMAPFNAPQYQMGPPQQGNPMRGANGPCFTCNQLGHVARNCPNNQNFRGNGQFRRGGYGGRGNSGRKFNGKKKN